MIAGWGAHDVWQFHNTFVIVDLTILRQDAPNSFLMAFDNNRSNPFEAVFCASKIPPFEPGMKVKSIVYEDTGACWNVSPSSHGLSYIFARDKNGRILREEL